MKFFRKILCAVLAAVMLTSFASVTAFAAAKSDSLLPAPKFAEARTESTSSISLSWDKVDGAEKYYIYEWVSDKPESPKYWLVKGRYVLKRSVTKPNPDAGGKMEPDYRTTFTGIKDDGQTAHVYKVAAVDVTDGKVTVGALSKLASAYTATAGKVTLDDVKGHFAISDGQKINGQLIELDPSTEEIQYEDYSDGDCWATFSGNYTAKIISDTEVELRVTSGENGWTFYSMRLVFDKSKNTLAVWTEEGAFDSPFLLEPDLPLYPLNK